jgi:ubiquinone/menaquinone biosynthesis C-methylase UbiE
MTRHASVDVYFESTANYWREIYEQNDVGSQIYQKRYRTVLGQVDSLQLPIGSRVLEVGCGAGHTTVALAKQGFNVESLDAAQAMADATRARVAREGLGSLVHTDVGDIYKLPYSDGQFLLALAIGVLPWLDDRDSAVKELARVVAPGGYVLLTMDNSRSLSRWLDPSLNPLLMPAKRWIGDRLARLRVRPRVARAHFCSNTAIDRTIERHGLQKMWSSTVGFGPFTVFNRPVCRDQAGVKLHMRLQAMADRNVSWIRGAGSHYLVLAKKRRNVS